MEPRDYMGVDGRQQIIMSEDGQCIRYCQPYQYLGYNSYSRRMEVEGRIRRNIKPQLKV